jgi:hypothetical protein
LPRGPGDGDKCLPTYFSNTPFRVGYERNFGTTFWAQLCLFSVYLSSILGAFRKHRVGGLNALVPSFFDGIATARMRLGGVFSRRGHTKLKSRQKSCKAVLPCELWKRSEISILPLHGYCNLLNCDIRVSACFPSFLAVAVRGMISQAGFWALKWDGTLFPRNHEFRARKT